MLRNDDLVTWTFFSHYWSFVRRQVSIMRTFDVCFVVKLIRDVEKSRVAGDSRRHEAYVTSFQWKV